MHQDYALRASLDSCVTSGRILVEILLDLIRATANDGLSN